MIRLNMRQKLRLGCCLLVLCSLFSFVVEAKAACPDQKLVELAGQKLMDAARAGSSEQFSNVLKTYGDMRTISFFALGRNKSHLAAGDTEAFVNLTTEYISRALNGFRLKFRANSISVVSCQEDITKSMMFFLGAKGDKPVLWRVRNGKIVDINVQNVWLAQLLRSNFDQILKVNHNDIRVLVEALKRPPDLE